MNKRLAGVTRPLDFLEVLPSVYLAESTICFTRLRLPIGLNLLFEVGQQLVAMV
jgi:hypothetical protein